MLCYPFLTGYTYAHVVSPSAQDKNREFKKDPVSTTPFYFPADQLVAQAKTRILAGIPPHGPYSILLQVGASPAAEKMALELRRGLEQEPRIVFASVTLIPGAPVEDIHRPGHHVSSQQYHITPPAQIVISVSEGKGIYYLAARLPGNDPLGPAAAGWLWILYGR